MFDYIRFSSNESLSITTNLVNVKLLAHGKLLVVSKHLVDTEHFASLEVFVKNTKSDISVIFVQN